VRLFDLTKYRGVKMPNPDLQSYLASLNEGEDLLKIEKKVPRDYAITALAMQLDQKKVDKVLIFPNIEGYSIPLVTNIFASRKRIARMIGCAEEDLAKGWLEAEEKRIKPEIVAEGSVQECLLTGDEVDVTKFPVMCHYVTDAGRYITSGIVVAKDPDTGIRNLSFHRIQLKTPTRAGISLHSRQHLWDYFRRAEAQNRPLEVAVIIGAHPLIVLAASAKTGIDVDEYEIAGGLLGEPLELVKARTIDVEYPAAAEIVFEGRILPNVHEPEGPFGEYTGYSTSRSTENVLEITAVCHRRNPVFLSIVAANSSDHLNLMRVAKEALVSERLKERIPNVRSIHYPKSGVNFHCVISMGEGAAGSVRQALMLMFGLDPYLKLVIAVDEDININDESDVMWALATRMQGDKDIFVVPNVWTNRLDPSSSGGVGAKVGIDATAAPDVDAIRCLSTEEHLALAEEILKGIGLA
jgi:UbiD family decarboxylase